MKKIYSIYAGILLATTVYAQPAAFWTENFGFGCNRGQLASTYVSTNGLWTITSNGAQGTHANQWYISATSAFTGSGICEDNCILSATDTNATLHLSNVQIIFPNVANLGADTGSRYYKGGIPNFTAATDRRVESPLINCTGQATISVTLAYLEGGQGALDGAVMEYSADGGVTWVLLDSMAKTTTCGAGLGEWAGLTVMLPASADNNPAVKFGFHWVNNEDNTGADPSFSVDSLTVIGTPTGIAAYNTGSVQVINFNGALEVKSDFAWKLVSVTNMLGQPVQSERQGNRIIPSIEAEGVYLVTLEVNGQQVVRKVLLNK
ncbi:MAG TPA: T9SS type A sorting domain-containing protein [Bacteroidia bacterium]|nr:T9SS type A sorting domain-containing protein [Bacteroidia bacterium]